MKKVLSMKPLSVLRLKEFTHLCTICMEEVQALGDGGTQNSWNRALCKPSNTSNAEIHLSRKHAENATVKAYFAEKKAGQESVGSLHSGLCELI